MAIYLERQRKIEFETPSADNIARTAAERTHCGGSTMASATLTKALLTAVEV